MSELSLRSDASGDSAGGVLVIGYGNPLLSDDGVGWHAAASLAAALLAGDSRLAGVEILARHQLTPELALDISGASLVIFVDAVANEPPGSIAVRQLAGAGPAPGSSAPGAGSAPGATSHHVGPAVLLAMARDLYGATPDAFVVGVGVADMEVGEALTRAVAAALPAVADSVAGLVAAHRRSGAAPG